MFKEALLRKNPHTGIFENFRQTKVDEFYRSVRLRGFKQEVLRLQVAVDNFFLMAIVQRIKYLFKYYSSLLFCEMASRCYPIKQLPSRTQPILRELLICGAITKNILHDQVHIGRVFIPFV